MDKAVEHVSTAHDDDTVETLAVSYSMNTDNGRCDPLWTSSATRSTGGPVRLALVPRQGWMPIFAESLTTESATHCANQRGSSQHQRRHRHTSQLPHSHRRIAKLKSYKLFKRNAHDSATPTPQPMTPTAQSLPAPQHNQYTRLEAHQANR